MQIVTSIPIIKGLPRDELTYFSAQKVAVGDIVTVHIQTREVRAIVTSVASAREAKSSVKSGGFALKKILKVEPGFIAPSMINSARETAEYYVTSVSKVLGAMYPKNVLRQAEESRVKSRKLKVGKFEQKIIEGTQKDRFDWISKKIEKEDRRVLYISPSNHELTKAKKFFKTDEVEPRRLIMGSPEYGFVWLPHVDTIILDHASGAGYHDRSSAKIDFRKVYELHAKRNNQQIIFADSVLDLTYVSTQDRLVYSVSSWPKVTIVKKEKRVEHTSWLVSKEAGSMVERIVDKDGKIFFFAPRKSVASMTICGDCGEVVHCEKCKRSLTLAKKNGKQIFVCPECKSMSPSDVTCERCDSWKLSPLGVTVESVANELEKLFPTAHVLRVSSDVTKTKTALAKVIKQFYATPGSILVGTELAIPYLEQPVSCAVISSLDSFLSGRSLSGTDKAARIIFDVAQIAGGKVLIETGDPKTQFFSDLESGDLKKYRERELTERKKCNYPPYSMIIKIGMETHFVNKENWPDRELVEKINSLPKGISYEIDADRAV